MAKGRKKLEMWQGFLAGSLLSLGIYLLGLLLLTLLVVKGALAEEGMCPAVAALCLLSALAGGALCAHRPVWGPLPSAMLCAVLFAGLLAVVGILCWEEGIAWTGHGGILMLCSLTGGLLAGVLGRGGRKKKKRKIGAL